MLWRNKVIWSEGLFLRPQHFQQHDRYLEQLAATMLHSAIDYPWGISTMELEASALAMGKVAVKQCKGIFPDGTPFCTPQDCQPPAAVDIPADLHDQIVYLCLPMHASAIAENCDRKNSSGLARYQVTEIDVDDANAGHKRNVCLQVGELQLKLMLEQENRDRYLSLGIARVRETQGEKGVILDNNYIPPCLSCQAHGNLKDHLQELNALLQNRAEALAARISQSGATVAEVSDFLMLQLVNRNIPLVTHLNTLPGLHPEQFYRTAIQLGGELASFTHEQKTAAQYPAYDHANPAQSFDAVMLDLKRSLSTVLEQKAVAIPMEQRQYGVRVAPIADISLLQHAQFVLAAKAKVPPEVLQTRFASQIKIGPVEFIRQMVNSGLPGIALNLLPVAPRYLPYHAGYTYFELDRNSKYWQGLEQSGAFAMHVSGEFPGLDLQLWAIKGQHR